MNEYQKIAFVFIKAGGYLAVLGAIREFIETIIYVSCRQLGLLPYFYFNVGAGIFIGFIYLAFGLLTIAISKPLGNHIGSYFDSDESDK